MVFFKMTGVAALALLAASSVEAMPAAPRSYAVGATGKHIKPVGTPWNHRLVEEETGYTVVRKKDEDKYVYATTDNLGYLAPTDLEVGVADPVVEESIVPGIEGRLDNIQQEAIKEASVGTPGEFRRRLQGSSTVRNFVLRLKFNDHQSRTYPSDDKYDLLFNKVTTPQNACDRSDECVTPTGSVKDFYYENSYQQMVLESTISPWQVTDQNEAYYGAGCSSTCNSITRLHSAIISALEDIDNSGFDWSGFDDGTGNIAMFSVVHSGYGAEYGVPDAYGTDHTDRIWSHKYYLSSSATGTGFRTRTGLRINTYHINPGLWDIEGSEAPHIGVISHESGHFLGLPDLYDTDGTSSGLGSFGLMANSWGFDGDQDNFPHLSAWSKAFVGFVEPETLSSSRTIEVAEVHSNPAVYKITHGFPSNEYLLIENRQAVSFDANMPQGGMLIWHIDENKAGSSNANNANEGYPGSSGWPNTHYHVALLQADGLYQLEKSRVRGDAGDVWTTGQVLSDVSVPSLNAYSKKGCQTATSGLTGNVIEIGAFNSNSLSLTMTYTQNDSCGCGQTCSSTSTPPPTAPGATPAPTNPGEECVDDPLGWYDADGPTYNCEWYGASSERCEQYGNSYENDGHTANQACCVCGGGSTGAGAPSTPAPVEQVCGDQPGWFDADGREYTCAWYAAEEARCEKYGDSFENLGATANQACCACGGGASAQRAPGSPSNVVSAKDAADVVNTGGDIGVAAIAAALVGGVIVGAAVGGVATKKYVASQSSDDEAALASQISAGNPIFESGDLQNKL